MQNNHPPAGRCHVDSAGNASWRPNPQFPQFTLEVPDVRSSELRQTNALNKFEKANQPGAQRWRQGLDLGIDTFKDLNRPVHNELIAYPLFSVNPLCGPMLGTNGLSGFAEVAFFSGEPSA